MEPHENDPDAGEPNGEPTPRGEPTGDPAPSEPSPPPQGVGPPIAKPPTPAPAAAQQGWDPGPAIARLNAPALLLLIVTAAAMLFSLCNSASSLIQVISGPDMMIKFYQDMGMPPPPREQMVISGIIGLGFGVVNLIVGGVILAGAWQMRRAQSHTLCVVAAALAFVPCAGPCYGCLTFPFGIWALTVLLNSDVKYVFDLNAKGQLPPGYV